MDGDETRIERIDVMVTQLVRHVGAWHAETRQQISKLGEEITGVRDELKGEIYGVRDELKGEICGVRDELKGEICSVRVELKAETNELHDGFRGVNARLEGRIEALQDDFSQLSEDVRVSWAESVRRWSDLGKRVQRLELKLSSDTGRTA